MQLQHWFAQPMIDCLYCRWMRMSKADLGILEKQCIMP